MAGRILTTSLLFLGVTLYHLRLAGLVRWIGRHHPKVLLYHDCSDAEDTYTADLNSTTPPALFGAHLDYLARHYAVVALEEIVAGQAPKGAVAITFDDGYSSVHDRAFPQLRARGMPAVVYLIGAVTDNYALVWVNELNHLLRVCDDSVRRRAAGLVGLGREATPAVIVDHCRVFFDPDMIAEVLALLRAATSDAATGAEQRTLYLSKAQISTMAANGIRFANHTLTHPNLERLSDEAQNVEIATAQKMLELIVPLMPSLAYPFGHYGQRTVEVAERLGLTSVAEVGGLNRRDRPQRIGRVHLSGEGLPQLFARMEVVEPIKGWLRDAGERRKAA